MAILDRNMSVLSRQDAMHPSEGKRHEPRRGAEGSEGPDRDGKQEPALSEAEQFARTLNETFQRSSYPPLRRLHATVDDNVVGIHGIVRSYYQKQIAQQAAMDLLGRRPASQGLANHIEVIR